MNLNFRHGYPVFKGTFANLKLQKFSSKFPNYNGALKLRFQHDISVASKTFNLSLTIAIQKSNGMLAISGNNPDQKTRIRKIP